MRRWCTTLTPGGLREKRNHDTLADATGRADTLAAAPGTRMTVWFNDDDGTGWHSHQVIDLQPRVGAA